MDNYQDNMQQTSIPNNYGIMSVKDWLIILLILCVPLVNIIMLFIWGFGSESNMNKKNYAKATLIMCAIMFVLYLILGAMLASVFMAALGGASTGY